MSQQSQLQQLLLLPNEAQNYLENLSAQNQKLSYQCEGQSILINDIAKSLPDIEDMTKKIEDVDFLLNDVLTGLKDAQAVLFELQQHPMPDSYAAGGILSSFLKNIIQLINDVILDSIEDEATDVSILDVMNIEEHILKIIGDLTDKNLFIESDQESHDRALFMKNHTEKILNFLEQTETPAAK